MFVHLDVCASVYLCMYVCIWCGREGERMCIFWSRGLEGPPKNSKQTYFLSTVVQEPTENLPLGQAFTNHFHLISLTT